MILYSAKSTIDAEGQFAYRITKFADGEVESSYICTPHVCDCPAGVRPTCRHRQMLPDMIRAGIINTHWFLDWDIQKCVVDFQGTPKHQLDALLPDDSAVAAKEVDLSDPVGEALQGDLPLDETPESDRMIVESVMAPAAPALPKPWRRM